MENSSRIPENPGVAVEMIKLLESKIPNLKITLIRRPWKRCMLILKAGIVEGIFNANFKPERLNR